MGVRAGKESELYAPMLGLLKLRRVLAWRNNTTGVWDPKKGCFRTFQGRKGVSDLLGVLPASVDGVNAAGRALAVEVKRPGEKPSEDQLSFLADVTRAGGLALVVDSLDALDRALTLAGY